MQSEPTQTDNAHECTIQLIIDYLHIFFYILKIIRISAVKYYYNLLFLNLINLPFEPPTSSGFNPSLARSLLQRIMKQVTEHYDNRKRY